MASKQKSSGSTANRFAFYAQTMPGVEDIAWLEIRSRLQKVSFGEKLYAKEQNGIVVFEYPGPLENLLQLRTTEDVFLEALSIAKVSRGREDLQQISDLVRKSESFGRAANKLLRFRRYSHPPTYRIISRKYGQHQYRRKDLEMAVLRGVQARYPRWTPLADQAQVEIWANLLGSRLLVGFRLSDRSMRHRFNKRVELPASLRPSMAAAMVFLTDPEPEDVFLDPLCGSGTILLERLYQGPAAALLGGDIAAARATAARQNLSAVSKKMKQTSVTIREWDARQLPLETGSIDKVASNLPFGQQIGTPEELGDLYTAVFQEMERVVRPGGRIVLLSSDFELVKTCIRSCSHLRIITGYSVATLGKWGRIHLVERS